MKAPLEPVALPPLIPPSMAKPPPPQSSVESHIQAPPLFMRVDAFPQPLKRIVLSQRINRSTVHRRYALLSAIFPPHLVVPRRLQAHHKASTAASYSAQLRPIAAISIRSTAVAKQCCR